MVAGVCIRFPRRQLARDLRSTRRGFTFDSINAICFLLVALIVYTKYIATMSFLQTATIDRVTLRLAKTSRALTYLKSRLLYIIKQVTQAFQTSFDRFASSLCLVHLRNPLYTCRYCVCSELCPKILHSLTSHQLVCEDLFIPLF